MVKKIFQSSVIVGFILFVTFGLGCSNGTDVVGPEDDTSGILQSHSEDDQFGNSNSKVNPGEQIIQVLTIKNISTETLYNVTTTLSESDAYVSVNDPSESWGNIGAGSTKTDTTPHTWTVSQSCPDGHVITFTLTMNASNGGPWTDTFTVVVY